MTNSTPPNNRRPGQDRRDSGKSSGFARNDKNDGFGKTERGPRSDRSDRPDRSDRSGRSDRPARSDRSDRPGRPDRGGRDDRKGGNGDNNRFGTGRGDRTGKPGGFSRQDRPFRPDRQAGDRPQFQDDPSRPAFPRPPRGASIIAEVCELDRELLKLIAKRSRLLAKLPARQTGSGNADNERELRLSWEKNAAQVSRDPKLIRQLFAILREVEVTPADMEQAPTFNLAPARKPLTVDLPAPASDRRARLAMTLAAAAGCPLELQGVPLNNPVIECLKMLNQVGGSLRWEDDGRILCREAAPVAGFVAGQTGRPGAVLDKVIHAGDDGLNLYLLLFLMTTRPARLKIIGEGDLKLADLSSLRHFLPQVGARLTAVIPGREGLPARLESSAMLPADIKVPADLPYDAAVALCLSAPFRDSAVTISLADRPDFANVLDEVLPVLHAAGVGAERLDQGLRVTPGRISFAQAPTSGIELSSAAALLAMPAFAGGKARLNGPWHSFASAGGAESERFAAMKTLLRQSGLNLEEGPDALTTNLPEGEAPAASTVNLADLSPALFPLGLALALLPALCNGKGELPPLPEALDPSLLDDFLLQAGLVRQGETLAPAGAGLSPAPWAAPSPEWALALALIAFVRPNLKLSNPAVVSALQPDFWNIYNTLPSPSLRPKAAEEAPTADKPARRRVLADYMPESERPEPLPFDEDY